MKAARIQEQQILKVYRVILPERPKRGLRGQGGHRHGVQELRWVYYRRATTAHHPDT